MHVKSHYQEEKYIKYVDGLKLMLDRYHTVLGSLNVAEVCVLYLQIKPVLAHLKSVGVNSNY